MYCVYGTKVYINIYVDVILPFYTCLTGQFVEWLIDWCIVLPSNNLVIACCSFICLLMSIFGLDRFISIKSEIGNPSVLCSFHLYPSGPNHQHLLYSRYCRVFFCCCNLYIVVIETELAIFLRFCSLFAELVVNIPVKMRIPYSF